MTSGEAVGLIPGRCFYALGGKCDRANRRRPRQPLQSAEPRHSPILVPRCIRRDLGVLIPECGCRWAALIARFLFVTCDPYSIQCSIDELGRTLTSFNFNELLATALATLAGVLVGAVLTLLISRGEAKHSRRLRDTEAEERRQERLNVALERVIWEINAHSVALRKVWERQQADRAKPEWLPPDFDILAAIAAARMIATNEDEKAVLNAIRQLTLDVRVAEVRKRIDALTLVWRTLILWREGSTKDDILDDIDELRRKALDGVGSAP